MLEYDWCLLEEIWSTGGRVSIAQVKIMKMVQLPPKGGNPGPLAWV